ncbi:histidine kinase [Pseudomonas gingeri]|uniref:Histidine kinase n=1 Tax=Pseudomonas gingeri TaxID=117681 RepID=A0A7Y7WMH9_9PSED|nr:histidine kinase [Pseudomonas gingeri]NWB84320.1 histidine kinase [Pseudomonas gingeri]
MSWNPRQLSARQSLMDSRTRMIDIQECLDHLELIPCDVDATQCLARHIRWLALSADTALLASTNGFCLELYNLINTPRFDKKMNDTTLQTLKKCCNLLAWQLELTNPRTGILHMDRREEIILLSELKKSLKSTLTITTRSFKTARLLTL